jgi:hypothetical protein
MMTDMKKLLAVSIALCGLTACSNKKDRETAAQGSTPHVPVTTKQINVEAPPAPGSGSAEAGSGSAGSAAPVNTGTVQKLGCDKILPEAVRTKYFKGATVEAADMGSGSCKITLADKAKSPASVTAMCWDGVPEGMLESSFKKLETLALTPPKEITAGKATRYTPTSATANMLVAWDDNSPCSISAELPKSVDIEAFAKDALATFPVP